MMPATHALASWALACLGGAKGRSGRLAVTLSGVVPDLDGLGCVVDFAAAKLGFQSFLFESGHHVLLHNFWAGAVCGIIGWRLAGRSVATGLLCLAAFNLHILCDLIGSAGADGEIWPVMYLWPFSSHEFSVSWQWRLDSPVNIGVTLALEALAVFLAWRDGRSPLELLSPKLDAYVFSLFRRLAGRA